MIAQRTSGTCPRIKGGKSKEQISSLQSKSSWESCTPYEKDEGAHREFWKGPLRNTQILFCGRGLKCFSSLRGISSETTYYPLLEILFGSIFYEGCRNSSRWGPFDPEHQRGTKITFNPWLENVNYYYWGIHCDVGHPVPFTPSYRPFNGDCPCITKITRCYNILVPPSLSPPPPHSYARVPVPCIPLSKSNHRFKSNVFNQNTKLYNAVHRHILDYITIFISGTAK